MRKFTKIIVIALVAIILGATMVQAVTSNELAQKLYNMGADYGVTSADKVKLERYFAENPVTDAEADKIVAKAEEAIAIMDAAGVKDVTKLSATDKDKIIALANEVADILGVTLKFTANSVSIYKDGKLIDTITSENGKLAYTGNTVNMYLVVSTVAVIALAGILVARKAVAKNEK